jgi:hypothetical protein
MRRYTNWGLVFISGTLAALSLSSPFWIPAIQPSLVEEPAVEAFTCAAYVSGEQCRTLREVYAENPELAVAQQAALDPENNREVLNEPEPQAIARSMMEGTSDEPNITVVKSGSFDQRDPLRGAEGDVRIYEIVTVAGDKITRILRFENRFERTFRVTNGPDLYVYLSQAENPADVNQMFAGEFGAIEVSVLKGDSGQQNYELSPDVDLTRYNSVVIYSKQFRVIYSVAPLTAQ